jgi:3-deoxy-manno-octulosonate cytidylyltransferase (CMP-KDO synthetase)
MDKDDNAIYFSRLPVPYKRNKDEKVKYYKHIGLYAFRKSFLTRYVRMKESSLEKAEKLEQLRILENGEKIRVVKTNHDSISIDTKEDLRKINKIKKFK